MVLTDQIGDLDLSTSHHEKKLLTVWGDSYNRDSNLGPVGPKFKCARLRHTVLGIVYN